MTLPRSRRPPDAADGARQPLAAVTLTDAELMELIRDARDLHGDAVAELYRRLYPVALGFARNWTSQAALAEDIATDALIKAWTRLAEGHRIWSPTAYLFVSVRNRYLSHLRSHERLSGLDAYLLAHGDDPDDAHVLDAVDTAIEVRAAFLALSERHRAILWATVVEGGSPTEIARAWGLTPAAAAVLAFRARRALASAIARGRHDSGDAGC